MSANAEVFFSSPYMLLHSQENQVLNLPNDLLYENKVQQYQGRVKDEQRGSTGKNFRGMASNYC